MSGYIKAITAAILIVAFHIFPADARSAGWSQQAVPLPTGALYDGLNSIACSSARRCTAVGWYQVPAGGYQLGLVERWNGRAWSIQPNLAGNNSGLNGVACPAVKRCLAVGEMVISGNNAFFAEIWNGNSWVASPVPQPAGMTSGILRAVACVSRTACFAVGTYSSASGALQPVVEKWDGHSWTLQQLNAPAQGILSGITCLSASDCFIAGTTIAGNSWQVLVEHWDGASWTMQETPALSDFEGQTPGRSWLAGVSCARRQCNAVGAIEYEGGLISQSLAEHWNGKSWVIESSPDPAGGYNNYLTGISCSSASACTAVGEDLNSDTGPNSGYLHLIVMQWNGSQWAEVTVPDPSDIGSWLFGVACAKTCFTVGGYDNPNGGFALAEHD